MAYRYDYSPMIAKKGAVSDCIHLPYPTSGVAILFEIGDENKNITARSGDLYLLPEPLILIKKDVIIGGYECITSIPF